MSNSNRSAPSLSILAALLACSCATEDTESEISVRTNQSQSEGSDSNGDGTNEDPKEYPSIGTEYVGWTASATCPDVDGWETDKLFTIGAETWCRYAEAASEPGVTPDVSLLDAKLNELDEDLLAIFPQTALHELTAPLLHTSFKARIGDVEAAQLMYPGGNTSTEGLRQDVTVAVVDTTPEWQVSPDQVNSMHGAHMGRIIDDIACPTPNDCPVTIDSVVGLPRTGEGPNTDTVGGFAGTHGDLAAALHTAVNNWSSSEAANRPLIINLSLGWETILVGDAPNGGEPGRVRAVRRALEYASCQGALIIAAVGNANEHCLDGPLAPAAWEGQTAPDNNQCGLLGVTTDFDPDAIRPLVYGVSGLAGPNTPMPGTRGFSNARLAAPATHIVAGNDAYTASLTGTSVAAASASGVAALVWSYNPDMTANEVMGVLYESGHDVSANADTFPGTPSTAPEVKRINACAAVQHACGLNSACTLQLGCVDDNGAQSLLDAMTIVAGHPAVETDSGPFPTIETCDVVCEARKAAGDAQGVCDDTKPDPAQALITPQPSDPACPECTLDGDELSGSLDPSYSTEYISSIVLRLYKKSEYQDFDLMGTFNLAAGVTSRTTLRGMNLNNVDKAAIRVRFGRFPNYVENSIRRF